MLRIHARRQHVIAEHRFDELAIAHAAEDGVGVDTRDPPDDEGVRFVAIELVAEEGDTEELVNVLSPEGEAAGFTGGDFVEEEDEVG